MNSPKREVAVWHDVDAATFAHEILPRARPAVLRGAAKDWPVAAAASKSAVAACEYLDRFYQGAPVEAFLGPAAIGGAFFYREDMGGFNFEKRRMNLAEFLRYLLAEAEAGDPAALYIGAASVPETLPGFDAENRLALLGSRDALPRIWIGNATTVATHFDMSDNIACVAAGRRRFTLFPPAALPDLYVGPLDNTMAGQPSSMVSLDNPDLEKYPRFARALELAEVAELGPGDAIYVPPLWWHHVRSDGPFNILVNHWWDEAPLAAGAPFEALAHGILTISHLPDQRREDWRVFFDHYVFQRNGDPAAHLPPEQRGILGAQTPQLIARMKQFLLRALTRN
ncbi:MAG TPA: cupin-like domain-containing protein [Allosphingosinicella sp.]